MEFFWSLLSYFWAPRLLAVLRLAGAMLSTARFVPSIQRRRRSLKSSGKILVFHYSNETKISSFYNHVSWDKIRVGQGAAVVMRLDERNQGLATLVQFDDSSGGAAALSLYVIRTISGQTISGVAVSNYVAWAPPGERIYRATGFGTHSSSNGVFVLSVNPDGSVSRVTAAKSLATSEENERAAQWLRKWRFKPNAVAQAQIPVGMRVSY